MIELNEIIAAQAVLPQVKAQNKKQLLQDLSTCLAKQIDIDQRLIFETLLTREKLGTTGIGHGIAIPHGKIPGLTRVHGLFARLSAPLAFEALDDQPVDLVFVLLAPDHAGADHLKALARVSRLLREPDVIAKLRGTTTAEGLYAILTSPEVTAAHRQAS